MGFASRFVRTGPVASLITGVVFRPFQGMKVKVPSGCRGKTSIFKMIMIGDVSSNLHGKSTRFY